MCRLVLALPDGFALFEERSEPFFEVGRGANARVFKDRAFEVGVDACGCGGSKQSLGARETAGAGGDELLCNFVTACQELFSGNNFGNEAKLLCFWSENRATGEQESACALVTELARQKDRDDRGEKTDFDYGIAELGFRHGNGEIAKRGDAATAGEGVAIDGGDRWLRKTPDTAKHTRHATRVFLIF